MYEPCVLAMCEGQVGPKWCHLGHLVQVVLRGEEQVCTSRVYEPCAKDKVGPNERGLGTLPGSPCRACKCGHVC